MQIQFDEARLTAVAQLFAEASHTLARELEAHARKVAADFEHAVIPLESGPLHPLSHPVNRRDR